MMKKMLTVLSSFSAIVVTTASVVSCGPMTFEQLMNRRVDTNTYYDFLKVPVVSWSTGKSNAAEDAKQIAQVADLLLQRDNYDNIIGDIADGWKTSEDFKTWTIHISDKAEWYDYKGNFIKKGDEDHYKIKAHDVANAMRYTFNPAAMSEIIEIYELLFQGASSLTKELKTLKEDFQNESKNHPEWDSKKIAFENMKYYINADKIISKYIKGDLPNQESWGMNAKNGSGEIDQSALEKYKQERDQFQKDHPELIMMEINDSDNTVVYNLAGPTEFFTSVLTYGGLAPMPDESVDWLNSHGNAINGLNYGKTYKDILNSGAYVVEKLTNSSLSFKANPNYRNKENVHIKRLVFSKLAKENPGSLREKFESGDFSVAPIKPQDDYAWKKYVGNDRENPNFEGIRTIESQSLTSNTLLYNFGSKRNADDKESWTNPVNKAIAQKSVRALISYGMDRKIYTKYFTAAADAPDADAPMLTLNHYSPRGLVNFKEPLDNKNVGQADGINDKVNDYADLIRDQYLIQSVKPANEALGKEVDWVKEADKTENGHDIFNKNDFLAYNSLSNQKLKDEFKVSKTYEEKIQILIKQVNEDFKKYNLNYSARNKLNLNWLTRIPIKDTELPYINDMVRTFNEAIPNNPIKISTTISKTSDEYLSVRNSGVGFQLMLAGWTPDFDDPSNYLNTVAYGGTYNMQQRYVEVVNAPATKDQQWTGKDPAFDDLATSIGKFTDGLKNASQEIGYDRYNEFAKLEVDYIYNNFMMNIINTPNLDMVPTLTYMNPFTLNKSEIGQAKAKYLGKKLNNRLWTKQEYEEAKKEYENLAEETEKKIYNWFNDNK